jgi:hypothetical protein
MSTKKTTKKKTKPTPKKKTKPRRAGASPLSTVTAGIAKFRREDIPGIIPTLKDMKDPHVTRAIERSGDIVALPILGGLHHRYARI